MTILSGAVSWLTDGDSGLSNIAAAIAILTFVFGLKPATRWASAVRRGVASQQFHIPGEPPLTPVSFPHCQIRMVRLAGPGPRDWAIKWTEIGGYEQTATATIQSWRLRWHLYWRRDLSEFPVVGEVSYLRAASGEPRFVEITALSYICGNWFSEYVIGGQWRRPLHRLVLYWSAPNQKRRRPSQRA